MKTKYLNLSRLQAGDILLTSENTFLSKAIVLVQRLAHFNFRAPGFSHAILVVSPLLWFDTTGKRGARFSRVAADSITENAGKIDLWLDITHFRNVAVLRFLDPLQAPSSTQLLNECVKENVSEYPSITGFLPAFHSSIGGVAHLFGLAKYFEYQSHQKKFCSSLVAEILTKFGSPKFSRKTAGQLSPFLLYEKDKLISVIEEEPSNKNSDEFHQWLLAHAQTISGAGSPINIDQFNWAIEDINSIISRGVLIRDSVVSDPDLQIMFQGQQISMIEFPGLSQYKELLGHLESTEEFLGTLKRRETCFEYCGKNCRNAASCEAQTNIAYAEMLARMSPEELQGYQAARSKLINIH